MLILEKIKNTASELSEDDLDWIIPELKEHYSNNINSLACRTYDFSNPESFPSGGNVALQAFQKQATEELRNGLFTYLFDSELWQQNRDVNTYLLTCLQRLSDRIKLDIASNKRLNVPICPVCRLHGGREYLHYESKLLRCHNCAKEIERIEFELEKNNNNVELQTELNLRRIFVLHTRRGYRCPDCEQFIPDSYIQQYGVTCPYSRCGFFGIKDELELMAHPLGLGSNTVSLSTPAAENREMIDFIGSQDVNADIQIEFKESYSKELDVLTSVIDSQMDQIERSEGGRNQQKLLMYEAYQNMIKNYTEDMISYLVHQDHSGAPIQSRIFQEYIKLIENSLPFKTSKGDVYSLLDPKLGIFLGKSEYEAKIRFDNIIPNNTVETYTGGRKLKFYGRCFIGYLADVEDIETGESLRNEVESYTFGQIMMKAHVPYDTLVKVTHFRIPPHYEMGGMVALQRIRRKIVDSVYFKLNGKKRSAK